MGNIIKGRKPGSNITIMNTLSWRGTDEKGKFNEYLTIVYKDLDTGLKYCEEKVNPDYEYYIAKQEEIPTIQKVEDYVHRRLIHYGQDLTAKAYEGYRAIQAFKKESNDTDEAILGLVRGTNEEAMAENSNKNAKSASTQRDLVAGEVSKSIMRRRILPAHFVQAHDDGILHYHDMDYGIQPIFNCCLVNMEDVLQNGTVINGGTIALGK